MGESKARMILARAKADPNFRAKLIHLGALRDRDTYSGIESWMTLGPVMLEFARDSGLLDEVDSQTALDQLVEWLMENADELAFYAEPIEKLPAGPRYQQPVGKVFLSWTVKNARGRASMLGDQESTRLF